MESNASAETAHVVAHGRLIITGTPGPRHWLANLQRDPLARLRLRDPACDLDVRAAEVTEPTLRRALIPEIWAAQPWYREQPYSQDDWVAGAPLVTLDERTG